MTLEEMKRMRRELGYSYAKLSELSGVPEPTIQKVFSGKTASPRFDTLQALEKAFRQTGDNRKNFTDNTDDKYKRSSDASFVRETTTYHVNFKYPRQGSYTIDDYFALPDDQRAELIDGVFYDMAPPVPVHQLIGGEVYYQISSFIRSNHGSCIPFMSPIGVQLDRDNRTMVEPDVIVVCDESLIQNRNIYGAPDFVLEVISPSTKRKDFTKKLGKYENAGVREYWLIDPYERRVFVYFFEDESCCPALYPIDAEIPVNLYDRELVVNLKEILRWLPDEQR